MDKPRLRILWIFYAASIGLHALLGLGASVAPDEPAQQESVTVALQEIQENQPKEEPPPPPPPPPPPKARPPPPPPPPSAAEPPKAEAAAEAPKGPAGFEDLGDMGGDDGSPGGIAMPMRAPKEASAPPPPKKVKVASLGPRPGDECAEEVVKPKVVKPPKPIYPESAHQANIEGVIEVEATIDEHGKVIPAKVLKGLGYGCDEAAVAAAKASEWTAATKCGKNITSTMKFKLHFHFTS